MVATGLQLPVQLAPSVHIGSYGTLLNGTFLDASSVKVIVNCGSTGRFLQYLNVMLPAIRSDVIVLNLDPSTSNTDIAYKEFHARFNKILQNYLAFFYTYNDNVKYFVNSNYQNSSLSFASPTMNGVPLKLLFNINRLLKLIKNVNSSVGVLFISETFGHQSLSNSLLYALAILYLMDNYNYNFEASYKYLQSLLPASYPEGGFDAPPLFSTNHYDDILLVDSLKKFHAENCQIKKSELGVMTQNAKLKRRVDSIDTAPTAGVKRVASSSYTIQDSF